MQHKLFYPLSLGAADGNRIHPANVMTAAIAIAQGIGLSRASHSAQEFPCDIFADSNTFPAFKIRDAERQP
jgi:hypothetical protein